MESVEGLLSTKEAANQWFLNDSTIRKAIKSKRFKEGIDCIKIGKQWLVSKEAMKREFGEMEITQLDSSVEQKIIDLILEDRLSSLIKNIRRDHVEDGYEFVLRDLFDQDDWRGISIWPGDRRLDVPFSEKIEKNHNYIQKIGNRKDGVALYRIDLSKFQHS